MKKHKFETEKNNYKFNRSQKNERFLEVLHNIRNSMIAIHGVKLTDNQIIQVLDGIRDQDGLDIMLIIGEMVVRR